jgi:hypothetical protein
METEAQIHNLLYEALELIDAPVDLLQIVGSWKDTQAEEETLQQLREFVERYKGA